MKAGIIVVLAVIVAAPIFVSAQNEASGTQRRENKQQPKSTSPISVNCNCTSETNDGKDKPQEWHKLVTWPEGIGTWALILTLGGILWQAKVSGTAARAAMQNIELYISKERARLRVGMKPLVFPDKPDPAYTVDFTVSIYGPTDAFITESLCVAYIFPEQVIDNPDLADRVMFPIHPLPAVIAAQAPPLNCYAFLGDEFLINEARKRRLVVGVRGFIKYKDTFERQRETTFRYVWRYEETTYGFGPDGDWVQNGRPEENHET